MFQLHYIKLYFFCRIKVTIYFFFIFIGPRRHYANAQNSCLKASPKMATNFKEEKQQGSLPGTTHTHCNELRMRVLLIPNYNSGRKLGPRFLEIT